MVGILLKMKVLSILVLSLLAISAAGYSQDTKSNLALYDVSAKEVSQSNDQQRSNQQQERTITGTITDINGEPVIGATVLVKGTTVGTITDVAGNFNLAIPDNAETLQFSFVGMQSQELAVGDRTVFDVVMEEETIGIDEVIVVGYGTQKRSDITGAVASLTRERLDMTPNLSIAQAIQGSIPGVQVHTGSGGANPDQTILVRGRNSITANNDPLIVVDGVPYGGNLTDINPNDVQAIEVLKDASSAAIYGSRGANGVILVTTKEGKAGKTIFSYEGKYGITNIAKTNNPLTGPEFYDFKMERSPTMMTQSEQDVHDAGTWVDWVELATRQGQSQEHNISFSGGSEKTKFYVGGGLTDVKGIAINDNYLRLSTRINLETEIKDWLSVGTRTQLSYEDESGDEANFEHCIEKNPLTTAYDEDGNLTIYPWPEQQVVSNPLQGLLFSDLDHSYQMVTNNYAIITVPWVEGLSYRLNTGLRMRTSESKQYRGTDTESGLPSGKSDLFNSVGTNVVVENIFTYNREFGKHTIFATGVYGFEGNKHRGFELDSEVFPNDFLTWHAVSSGVIQEPSTSFSESNLISQMLRLNYSFASRYLLTFTVRRDGFSGFGADTKWGVFPSVALGWNLANEDFFPLKDLFSSMKLRASIGSNGNQAIGPYESISRLIEANIVSGINTQFGYKPARLGNAELGWETSQTFNVGLDFGMFENRISGNIDYYLTYTSDLLLDRTISAVHGVTPVTHLPGGWVQPAITQNIGETKNNGFELFLSSRNIVQRKFSWATTGNISFNKNEIVSLYGLLDEEGNEVDDLANNWIIGEPVRVNFDYVWDGVWQEEEADLAASYDPRSKPGFVKLKDGNGDGVLDDEDREVIGQTDPSMIWGMNNTFSYGDFKLNIFMHGVHGLTIRNYLMADNVQGREVRYNTSKKTWWTPENRTNEWVKNEINADQMNGHSGHVYQDASYVRIKDISLSYDLPGSWIGKAGLSRVRFYVTLRNMFTFTDWGGMDPELIDVKSQQKIPLTKQYIFGLSLAF